MFTKTRPLSPSNQKGFTLVEILLVLALLVLVIAGIYQFFFFTNRVYSNTENQSISIQEANLFIMQVEKDIRSASQPNGSTTAIRVLNSAGSQARKGQQMDIYHYNEDTALYERISYKINGTQLLKGIAASSSQVLTANPQYKTITEWETIVTNLNNYENTEFLFADASNDGTVTSERRLIKVNLKILNPEDNRPLNFQTSCLSRSGRSTTSQIASGDTTTITIVPVSGITVKDSAGNEITDISTNGQQQTITVTAAVSPEDADKQTVSWSKNNNWVALGKTTTSSGEEQTITLTAITGGGGGGGGGGSNSRSATISIKSTDGSNITKILTITQTRKPVTGINITELNGTVITSKTVNKNEQQITVKGVVTPADADNNNITWSKQNGRNWITLEKVITSSGEEQIIILSVNNGSQRSAEIYARPADGSNISKTLTITQNK